MKTDNLTKDQLAVLEIALIPQALRDDEAELMQSRWFDYRHMMPIQATEHFARTYSEVYREGYAKSFDYRKAEDINPLGANLFKSSDFISFWRARQAADRIGCRYDFFLRTAFARNFDRGWRYFPRPNQLYGDELVDDVRDAWAQATGAALQLAKHPRFTVSAYSGHPDQDAYHSYLLGEIARREHKHLVIARLVYREQHLPEEIAGSHFGSDLVSRARRV